MTRPQAWDNSSLLNAVWSPSGRIQAHMHISKLTPCLPQICSPIWIWRGCTRIVNQERYQKMLLAREFFMKCLNAQAHYVAVENPLPMARAELPKPTCYACPSWFGVKYTKKTLYWLKNLPPIMAERVYSCPKEYVHSSRGKYRSRTFPEMAAGIARQWSKFILDDMQTRARMKDRQKQK